MVFAVPQTAAGTGAVGTEMEQGEWVQGVFLRRCDLTLMQRFLHYLQREPTR